MHMCIYIWIYEILKYVCVYMYEYMNIWIYEYMNVWIYEYIWIYEILKYVYTLHMYIACTLLYTGDYFENEVCCSVLQCVAVCCSVLPATTTKTRSVAVFCSVLQCVAVHCSVLQCVLTAPFFGATPKLEYCSVLQDVAVCCSVLQCIAVYCSVLQCVAFSLTRTHPECMYHIWKINFQTSEMYIYYNIT